MTVLLLPPQVARNFWSKVQQRGECWEWTGHLTEKGYGQFGLDGKPFLAHRVSYMLHIGELPEDLTVDHLCMNKRCVNPLHLECVTRGENIRRAWAAGLNPYPALAARNRQKTHCSRGHAFDEENTAISPDGHRSCRTCRREADRRRRSPDKPLRTCAKCGEQGHYGKTCPKITLTGVPAGASG